MLSENILTTEYSCLWYILRRDQRFILSQNGENYGLLMWAREDNVKVKQEFETCLTGPPVMRFLSISYTQLEK